MEEVDKEKGQNEQRRQGMKWLEKVWMELSGREKGCSGMEERRQGMKWKKEWME